MVVQGCKKNPKGRYLDKVGEWRPRIGAKNYDREYILDIQKVNYWISVGAQPTPAVRRILEWYEILPKKPPPFGSHHVVPWKPSESIDYSKERYYEMNYLSPEHV